MVTCPTSHDRAVRPISIWASPVPAAARPPVKNNGRDGAIMMTVRRCYYLHCILGPCAYRTAFDPPNRDPRGSLCNAWPCPGDPSGPCIIPACGAQTTVHPETIGSPPSRRPHFAHLWVRLLERASPSIPDAGSSDRLFVRFQPRCWSNGRALIPCIGANANKAPIANT